MANWLGQVVGLALELWFGGAAVLTMISVRLYVPDTPANSASSPLRELSALRRSQVWLTLGIGSVGFGGLFLTIF